jgi:hypothetical protein
VIAINRVPLVVTLLVVMVFRLLVVVVWTATVVVSAMSLKLAGSKSSGLKVPLAFIWVGIVGKGDGSNALAGVLVAMCDDGVGCLFCRHGGGVCGLGKFWGS